MEDSLRLLRAARASRPRVAKAVRLLPGHPFCDHQWSYPYGANFTGAGVPQSWLSVCNRCGRHLRQG